MLREPQELLPAMPPSVACALVETSTGNHRPCGLSAAFSASSTMPGSTSTVIGARGRTRAPRAGACWCRRPARRRRSGRIGWSAAARQERHLQLARDVERRGDVVLAPRHEDADRHDLVDRGIGRVAAARSGVEQHLALGLGAQAARKPLTDVVGQGGRQRIDGFGQLEVQHGAPLRTKMALYGASRTF